MIPLAQIVESWIPVSEASSLEFDKDFSIESKLERDRKKASSPNLTTIMILTMITMITIAIVIIIMMPIHNYKPPQILLGIPTLHQKSNSVDSNYTDSG